MILVRHGQSDFNAGKSKHYNSHLSDIGREEAKGVAFRLSNMFKDKYVAIIISSPFRRCIETAAYISGICGGNIVIDSRLREHTCPKNGFTRDNSSSLTEDFWLVNNSCYITRLDSDDDIIRRAKYFYEEYNHSNYIVVSHGGPINILTMLAEGKTVDKYPEWDGSIKNCSITDTNNMEEFYKYV